jgi:hypothetical protein
MMVVRILLFLLVRKEIYCIKITKLNIDVDMLLLIFFLL